MYPSQLETSQKRPDTHVSTVITESLPASPHVHSLYMAAGGGQRGSRLRQACVARRYSEAAAATSAFFASLCMQTKHHAATMMPQSACHSATATGIAFVRFSLIPSLLNLSVRNCHYYRNSRVSFDYRWWLIDGFLDSCFASRSIFVFLELIKF